MTALGVGRRGAGRARGLAASCIVGVSIMAGCGGEPAQAPLPIDLQPSPVCNDLRITTAGDVRGVVLVLNDTMRHDIMSLYGGPASMPRVEAFASEALVFDGAVAQAPWTKPSVATLFTSLHPSQHRVESHPRLAGRPKAAKPGKPGEPIEPVEADVLAPSLVTLAESLRASGLRTAAFVANPWLVEPFGFDQGFETYDASFARWGAGGEAVIDAGLDWLAQLEKGDRFFLYLHTIDSHRPYGQIPIEDLDRTRARVNAGRPLPTREAQRFAARIRLADGRFAKDAGFAPTDALLREAYVRGVEQFDPLFGRLLDGLAARPGLDAGTAVILTSDHGEALYERGWGNHGGALYEEDVRVPLVARLPGIAPAAGRLDCAVGLVDLMPTLCDYVGASCPADVQGLSLLGATRSDGAPPARYLVSEGVMRRASDRAIRTSRYKLVHTPGLGERSDAMADYALFDLAADAHESVDRLDPATRNAEAERAFEVLKPALEEAVPAMPAPEHGSAPLDDDVRRQLEALGYGEMPETR